MHRTTLSWKQENNKSHVLRDLYGCSLSHTGQTKSDVAYMAANTKQNKVSVVSLAESCGTVCKGLVEYDRCIWASEIWAWRPQGRRMSTLTQTNVVWCTRSSGVSFTNSSRFVTRRLYWAVNNKELFFELLTPRQKVCFRSSVLALSYNYCPFFAVIQKFCTTCMQYTMIDQVCLQVINESCK